MSISLTHKYPTGVRPMERMFQDHNLGGKFHRSTPDARNNLRQGMQRISTKTTNGSVTGFVL